MENTGTHLHNVLGDENVLTVKFADVPGEATYCNDIYSTYKEIAKKGIMLGLRRYQFFGELFSFFLLIDNHSCHCKVLLLYCLLCAKTISNVFCYFHL